MLSGSNMASKTPSRHSKAPPRASKTPSRTSKTSSRRLQDALKSLQNVIKSMIFLGFFQGFSDLFDLLVILMLSWSNMASKTPSRPSKTPPKASKTPSRTSKTPPKAPPRRPQEPPRRSEVLDFLCLFAGFSNIFRFVRHLGAILVQHGLQDAIKTLQDTSKSLQDALKNFQDAPKTPSRRPQEPAKRLSNSLLLSLTCQVSAKFVPSHCQIAKYARDVCPQWSSTMVYSAKDVAVYQGWSGGGSPA